MGEHQSYRSWIAQAQQRKLIAANREKVKDLCEKTIPFKSVEGVHRCIIFRSANVVKPLISKRKDVQAGNVVVLDEKNPHIRNNRDGTVIKLWCEQLGVHPWTCGCVSVRLVRFSVGKDTERLECHKLTCKTRDDVQRRK